MVTYEAIKVQLLLLGYKKQKDSIGNYWFNNKMKISIEFAHYGFNPVIKVKIDGKHIRHFYNYDIFKEYLDGIKLTKRIGKNINIPNHDL